jgi:hypothetical protein
MSELLERIRGEIHERLAVSRAAAEEYQRLEAALAALSGSASGSERPATARKPKQATKRPAQRATAGPRAPRGANREAVLRLLDDRPGVGVSELAGATGVKKPVLYALLARLLQEGEVVKEALPSGSTGYALAREGASGATPAPASAPVPSATADERDAGDDWSADPAENRAQDASVSALAA